MIMPGIGRPLLRVSGETRRLLGLTLGSAAVPLCAQLCGSSALPVVAALVVVELVHSAPMWLRFSALSGRRESFLSLGGASFILLLLLILARKYTIIYCKWKLLCLLLFGVMHQARLRSPDLDLAFWFSSFYFLWLWRLKSCQNSHTFKSPKLERMIMFHSNPCFRFLVRLKKM